MTFYTPQKIVNCICPTFYHVCCIETMGVSQLHVWEITAKPWLLSRRNVTNCAVTLVVTCSETDSAKLMMNVYNFRKLQYSSKSLQSFYQRQKAPLFVW